MLREVCLDVLIISTQTKNPCITSSGSEVYSIKLYKVLRVNFGPHTIQSCKLEDTTYSIKAWMLGKTSIKQQITIFQIAVFYVITPCSLVVTVTTVVIVELQIMPVYWMNSPMLCIHELLFQRNFQEKMWEVSHIRHHILTSHVFLTCFFLSLWLLT
jgi:hypothetical protein